MGLTPLDLWPWYPDDRPQRRLITDNRGSLERPKPVLDDDISQE